ncbi:hypothetical protein [Terriglobus albidus]|uniref:hypothetical protein n=1 Tax=Terriglobus albidus TaxID=1592106 RepID=UPI0021E0A526|nr:hypothetical protein [Terriglobus albidus]
MAKKIAKTQLREIYVGGLRSQRCICGKPKARREAFCTKCKAALPKLTKAGILGDNVDSGAESYSDSVKWLEENAYLADGAHAGTFGGKA